MADFPALSTAEALGTTLLWGVWPARFSEAYQMPEWELCKRVEVNSPQTPLRGFGKTLPLPVSWR